MTDLIQVRGNTCYMPLWQDIPIYKTDARHCILLDTGLLEQREYIEDMLRRANLTPVGILGTHVHIDHAGNHRYFQEKYRIPTALPALEAALCCSPLNLKAYFYPMSPGQAAADPDTSQLLIRPDIVIPQEATRTEVAGVPFEIIHTPGHSPGHICIRTPDNVLYLGDALMAGQELEDARLPYFFCIRESFHSIRKLLQEPAAACCIAAHKGVISSLEKAARETEASVFRQGEIIRSFAAEAATMDDIYRKATREFSLLTGQVIKAGVFQRTIRTYVEFLLDIGVFSTFARDGISYFQDTGAPIML